MGSAAFFAVVWHPTSDTISSAARAALAIDFERRFTIILLMIVLIKQYSSQTIPQELKTALLIHEKIAFSRSFQQAIWPCGYEKGHRQRDAPSNRKTNGHYIKSFGLRAVLPVFSQYASWRNLPFSKTLLILIAPPQRLNKVLVPARCAFLDTAPAISLSSRKGISRNVRMYYSKEPKIKSNPKYTSFLDLTQEIPSLES